MKKTIFFFLLFAFAANFFPAPAHAQGNDAVNLTIQALDADSKSDEKSSVLIIRDTQAGVTLQKYLDEQSKATFEDMPMEQFTLQLTSPDSKTARLVICLYRGSKTAILSNSQGITDVSVANGALNLSLGVADVGGEQPQLYVLSRDAAGAFATLPPSKPSYGPDAMDLKFFFKDTAGASIHSLSLQVDAGDPLPANLDGEVYVSSLRAGTHKLTAFSNSGAQIAQSYITLVRERETILNGANQSNPTLAVKEGLDKLYVQADIQNNLVQVSQISSDPIEPGTQPQQANIAVRGCLVDSALRPLSGMRISLGDFTSTTDGGGLFGLNDLPLDKYLVVARDEDGKKIASATLLMQKGEATGLTDVSLTSATLSIDGQSPTVFLTMQITDDHALMLTAVSDTSLSIPSPSMTLAKALPAATGTPAAPANKVPALSVYIYLFAVVMVLIVLIVYLLVKLRAANKPKH